MQAHKHVARRHLAIWAPYRGAEPLRTCTERIPPQRRPTSPRRRLSRTRTCASQRARPPICTRRSPASSRTRARAAGRWCLSAARGRCSDDIDLAAPCDRRLPPLAAPRGSSDSGMSRKRPAHMGTHIPAQNEHANIENMPPRGPVRACRAPRLVSSSRKGRGGAMRAPQGCASWPN